VFRTSRFSCGFTLIELLVVVSILAVLMSLLMPSIIKSRESARQLLCASRMRQVGVLAGAYQADTGYMLPHHSTVQGDPATTLVYPTSNRREVGYSWSGNLILSGYVGDHELLPQSSSPFSYAAKQPYWDGTLRKSGVFLCPSGRYFAGGTTQTFSSVGSSRAWPDGVQTVAARDIVDSHLYTHSDPLVARFPSTTYHVTVNSYMVTVHSAWLVPLKFSGWADAADNLGWVPKREIRPVSGQHLVATPSNTIYLAEAHNSDIREATMASETPTTLVNRRFRIPHQDRANYMAVDGHVGLVERNHFGSTNINDRPFVWGEYRGFN
jgi:prepilin-type N-terminal cleavage/methylation domain-containing protein/prepilin-type processing-associated H-X9-DG protein